LPRDPRHSGRRTKAPTDLRLGLTGAVAAGATVLFYVAVVYPLRGTYVGDIFGDRGWVPYVVTFLSLWAGVVLILKYRVVARQREALELDLLPERLGDRITPDNAPEFVSHLDQLPASAAGNLLVERIRRALQHFAARRDARELVDQLGTQAQTDADAVESSYTMVRVFIWAVPILGFIGTVIGISAAVGGFSESVGAAVDLEVMKNSIGTVTTGLGVAFDTTLLALVMSIFIMFPASSLQKAEEDFLAEVEDYCDVCLVRRLDDGSRSDVSDPERIEEAIAREMARHHAELRGWLDRLGQIGETLTAHVVSGWEKVDEQQRLSQDQRLELLGQWASNRQREASDELAETQRGLMRDFRALLEGMSAEARRIQEEGAHRLDDQLAGIERLHRRLVESQGAAAEAHRAQTQTLMSAADQLARTLARVRSEAGEVRGETARQLDLFAETLKDAGRSAQEFQREALEAQEVHARALKESVDRLAGTLARVDEQLAQIEQTRVAQVEGGAAQLDELRRARNEALRTERDVRESQLAALRESTDQLRQTLEALRSEARGAKLALEGRLGEVAPELVSRVESLAEELAEPWRQQLAHLERIYERLAQQADLEGPDGDGSWTRRLFRRS
jgi:biopolymer transport protein ExbB/TolQ